jgi:hypothetical protein
MTKQPDCLRGSESEWAELHSEDEVGAWDEYKNVRRWENFKLDPKETVRKGMDCIKRLKIFLREIFLACYLFAS